VLAGKWDSGLRTRLLNRVFFAIVVIQKRFSLTRMMFRRNPSAGYPGE